MNDALHLRALGIVPPRTLARHFTSSLLHALQPAPGVRFSSALTPADGSATRAEDGEEEVAVKAHGSGVNALVVDRFEGRWMISGGADASIFLWDLERAPVSGKGILHSPVGAVAKGPRSHRFGATALSFYPFDAQGFLSSSYDHTLNVYATDTLAVATSFDLDSVVYAHALSPIAAHLLVACATQHPAVRLVDLRSGASGHALAGHCGGAVLSVAWSPTDEHVLASAGVDGCVRLWDVRRSAGSLGVLDLEDSVGVAGYDGRGTGARRKDRGRAHAGAANGLAWTDDGAFLLTTGHDERVRVWDVGRGANTLANFGPLVRNRHLSAVWPLIPPSDLVQAGGQVVFLPNDKEILMFDLLEGRLLKRLRSPASTRRPKMGGGDRVTDLAWRCGSVELYSAHSDGAIRAWLPRTREDDELDAAERSGADGGDAEAEDEGQKRKRQVLDDVYRDLTRQRITFG
ncbi:MAG: hypothetical protein M1832_005616 [Thelocarpon impressellum]|nr:MAG: hypothetical protein M1832_005616 [Thelocarpon impressellum]